jgi:hypothetical protein
MVQPNTRGDNPAENGFAVTPNDSTDLTATTRALFVGGAGNLRITTSGGDTFTMTGVLAGSLIPVRVVRVLSTGTTATNIAALY